MFYKLNNITGRVVRAGQSLGQGLKSGSAEPTQIVYGSHTKFAKVPTDTMSLARAKSGYGEMSPAVLEKMKKFQADDGVPIHIKGGPADKALYGLTLVACALGLAGSIEYIYGASFPKKE